MKAGLELLVVVACIAAIVGVGLYAAVHISCGDALFFKGCVVH